MEGTRRLAGAHRDDDGGLRHVEIRAGDHPASLYAQRGAGLRDSRFRRDGDCRRVWRIPEQIRTGPRRVGDHPDGRRGRGMNKSQMQRNTSAYSEAIPNGPGAAAILAAGIGCAAVGTLALAGDASQVIKKVLNFSNPTGPLSGVTTVAIIVWLVSWLALNRLWQRRTVAMVKVNVAA